MNDDTNKSEVIYYITTKKIAMDQTIYKVSPLLSHLGFHLYHLPSRTQILLGCKLKEEAFLYAELTKPYENMKGKEY